MSTRFVTFEGGEGAGKTTQIARLAERLRKAGFDVVTTREPGGSPYAERLRGTILSGEAKALGPFAEALLFARARRDHVETTIRPALGRDAVVLCDRFADSTRAYQGAAGAVAPPLIDILERWAVGPTRPDLTLVLDLPVDVALARAAARRGGDTADRYEGEARTFHEALRDAFRAIAEAEPQRCVLIDARGDADAVARRIAEIALPRIGAPPAGQGGARDGSPREAAAHG